MNEKLQLWFYVILPGALGLVLFAHTFRDKPPEVVYQPTCFVTNLEDSGPGSFRDCVERDNMTVVLEVSGVIEAREPVEWGDSVSVVGQTSDGTCYLGNLPTSNFSMSNVYCGYGSVWGDNDEAVDIDARWFTPYCITARGDTITYRDERPAECVIW